MLERLSYRSGYAARPLALRAAESLAARVRILLVVYGVAFAAFGVIHLDHAIHGAATIGLSPYRQDQLRASLDVLRAQGPPLTGVRARAGNDLYPLAIDDDRGSFIYVPLVSRALNSQDLNGILKWWFIAFFLPVLVVYPILLYELTGSIGAAIAAPPILVAHTPFLRTSGIFWVPAWADLLLLPFLLLAARRWAPSRLWLLTPLAVVASFASSIRANAGLGFVIGAAILVLVRMPRWHIRIASVVMIAAAYLSVGTLAMHAVQKQRDDVVGRDFTSPYPNGHPFWHNAYIGLGYLRNPYGIRLEDVSAVAAAREQDPGAVFPTKRYERALRTVYLRFVRDHPGFVLHEYALKTAVVIWRAFKWFPALWVIAPLALVFAPGRRDYRFDFLLVAGAGVVGAAAGVLTNPGPYTETQSGWYGFLLLLWLVCLGWAARPVEQWAFHAARRSVDRVDRADPPLPWSEWWALRLRARAVTAVAQGRLEDAASGARRLVAGTNGPRLRRFAGRMAIAGVIAAGVVAAAQSGASSNASAAYWQRQAPFVPRAAAIGETLARWSFEAGVPRDWTAYAGRARPQDGRLVVRTTTQRFGYQITSGEHRLRPGSYTLLIDGRVTNGGLLIGAVDATRETFVNTSIYSSAQTYTRTTLMALPFDIAEPTPVEFVLSNFNIEGGESDWALRSIALVRAPRGCRLGDPLAWFTRRSGRGGS